MVIPTPKKLLTVLSGYQLCQTISSRLMKGIQAVRVKIKESTNQIHKTMATAHWKF